MNGWMKNLFIAGSVLGGAVLLDALIPEKSKSEESDNVVPEVIPETVQTTIS